MNDWVCWYWQLSVGFLGFESSSLLFPSSGFSSYCRAKNLEMRCFRGSLLLDGYVDHVGCGYVRSVECLLIKDYISTDFDFACVWVPEAIGFLGSAIAQEKILYFLREISFSRFWAHGCFFCRSKNS